MKNGNKKRLEVLKKRKGTSIEEFFRISIDKTFRDMRVVIKSPLQWGVIKSAKENKNHPILSKWR